MPYLNPQEYTRKRARVWEYMHMTIFVLKLYGG